MLWRYICLMPKPFTVDGIKLTYIYENYSFYTRVFDAVILF